MAVILSCSVQNFEMIILLRWILWTNMFLWDLSWKWIWTDRYSVWVPNKNSVWLCLCISQISSEMEKWSWRCLYYNWDVAVIDMMTCNDSVVRKQSVWLIFYFSVCARKNTEIEYIWDIPVPIGNQMGIFSNIWICYYHVFENNFLNPGV